MVPNPGATLLSHASKVTYKLCHASKVTVNYVTQVK